MYYYHVLFIILCVSLFLYCNVLPYCSLHLNLFATRRLRYARENGYALTGRASGYPHAVSILYLVNKFNNKRDISASKKCCSGWDRSRVRGYFIKKIKIVVCAD